MHETLHEVISSIEKERGIIFPLITGGIGYNETRRFCLTPNYILEKLSTKSKKMLQVIVNRLDNGRYELISYVL